MLNLSLQDYQKYRDPVVRGFKKASKILFENHIYTARDLPYNTQLIPMSVILAVLGDKIDNIGYKKEVNAVVLVWRFRGALRLSK